MKVLKDNWPVAAIVIGLLISLLSGLVVQKPEVTGLESPSYDIGYGQSVLCDTDKGSGSNICVGEYTRGWPISYTDGLVVLGTEERLNDRRDFSPTNFVLNSALLGAPFFALLWSRLERRK